MSEDTKLQWETLKKTKIDMFGLPNQTIESYCKLAFESPDAVYMTYRASAVLQAIESALGSGFDVSFQDKYLVVSKAKKEEFEKVKPEVYIQGISKNAAV